MRKASHTLAATVAACSIGLFGAGTASAQNVQEGLVNVAVEDVVVQLPIAIAANVCDVNVAVLADIADAGGTCTATADSAATAGRGGNGGPTRQRGLINILVDDVVVQVPVALAANICDVNVALLAEVEDDEAVCDAAADADANAPGAGGGGAAQAFEPIDLSGTVGLIRLDNNRLTTTGLPFP